MKQKITLMIERPETDPEGEKMVGDGQGLLELLLEEEINRGYAKSYEILSAEDITD